MNKKVSIFDFKNQIVRAWQDYKQRPYFLSFSTLIIILLIFVSDSYQEITVDSTNIWITLIGLVIVIFLLQMLTGIFHIALKAINQHKPVFKDFLVGMVQIVRFFGVLVIFSILGFLVIVLSQLPIVLVWKQTQIIYYNLSILLILGFYFYLVISLQFIYFGIINHGLIDSVKQSWQMVSGYRLKLLWFWVVLIIFNLIGFLILGLGLLVTLPLSFLAFARVYQQLKIKNHTKSSKIKV